MRSWIPLMMMIIIIMVIMITIKHTLVHFCWRWCGELCLELEIHEAIQWWSHSQRRGKRLREGRRFAQSHAGTARDGWVHHWTKETPHCGKHAQWSQSVAEDTRAKFKIGLAGNTLEIFQFRSCVSAVPQLSIHKHTLLDACTKLS